MAETKKSSSGVNWKWIINFVSFVALALVGLALLIAIPFNGNEVSGALRKIAEILAYLVVAFYAFFFAWNHKGRKQLIYMLIWLAAVILIIVGLVM